MLDDWLQPETPPMVTTSDLNRSPGRVLERVEHGETIVVCRRGRPVAILQPLEAKALKTLAEGIEGEIDGLSEPERALLTDGLTVGNRLTISRVMGDLPVEDVREAVAALELKGLCRKLELGRGFTPLGLALRERLLQLGI